MNEKKDAISNLTMEELSQQRQLLSQENMGAKRFILKYSDYQDIIIDAVGTR